MSSDKKLSLADKMPIKLSILTVNFKNAFNRTIYKNTDSKNKEAKDGREQEQNLL